MRAVKKNPANATSRTAYYNELPPIGACCGALICTKSNAQKPPTANMNRHAAAAAVAARYCTAAGTEHRSTCTHYQHALLLSCSSRNRAPARPPIPHGASRPPPQHRRRQQREERRQRLCVDESRRIIRTVVAVPSLRRREIPPHILSDASRHVRCSSAHVHHAAL